jgi:hypothetical protein
LDSGLKGRIADFDVHGLTLQKGIRVPLIVSERVILSRKRRDFWAEDHVFHLFGVSGFIILFSVAGRN